MRWLGVATLAIIGFVIIGDWIWWGIEVAGNPPSTLYAGEFLLRCGVSIAYGAILYRSASRG